MAYTGENNIDTPLRLSTANKMKPPGLQSPEEIEARRVENARRVAEYNELRKGGYTKPETTSAQPTRTQRFFGQLWRIVCALGEPRHS